MLNRDPSKSVYRTASAGFNSLSGRTELKASPKRKLSFRKVEVQLSRRLSMSQLIQTWQLWTTFTIIILIPGKHNLPLVVAMLSKPNLDEFIVVRNPSLPNAFMSRKESYSGIFGGNISVPQLQSLGTPYVCPSVLILRGACDCVYQNAYKFIYNGKQGTHQNYF